MEAVAVLDQTAKDRSVHVLAAEPHVRSLGTPALRLDVDVLEGVVVPVEGGGGLAPDEAHDRELLIEDPAALAERHPHGGVLRLEPRHRRLHDQTPLAQQIEGGELRRGVERMAQGIDERREGDAEPCRARGDGARQDDRIWPGRQRILIPGRRVVARVGHASGCSGLRGE